MLKLRISRFNKTKYILPKQTHKMFHLMKQNRAD